jgi:hypothetical protein
MKSESIKLVQGVALAAQLFLRRLNLHRLKIREENGEVRL